MALKRKHKCTGCLLPFGRGTSALTAPAGFLSGMSVVSLETGDGHLNRGEARPLLAGSSAAPSPQLPMLSTWLYTVEYVPGDLCSWGVHFKKKRKSMSNSFCEARNPFVMGSNHCPSPSLPWLILIGWIDRYFLGRFGGLLKGFARC